MEKLKRAEQHNHWRTVSDLDLVDAELSTDSPEHLEDLVYEIPGGDEEPYIEFKYDLRRQDRQRLRCVHGNHPHLAGYVVRKGNTRFPVGHMCGDKIYGADFKQITEDFHAAVNRQQVLKKRREIEDGLRPFIEWLTSIAQSGIFDRYESVKGQVTEHMPWVVEKMSFIAAIAHGLGEGPAVPRRLFGEHTDPRRDFNQIVNEFSSLALRLAGQQELTDRVVGEVRMTGLKQLGLIGVVFDELQEVVEFFQPEMLATICGIANEYDNPNKRTYEAGLLSLTCTRSKGTFRTVYIPKQYNVPGREPIENMKKILSTW
jgi:hypothetical protein